MTLCPTHHDQATKGAMPEAEQRGYKARPYNIQRNRVNGPLEVKQDYCAADFGSVTVVGDGTFLSIDGEAILGFHLGEKNLEISLLLYDEADNLVLEIDRNEWVSGDALPWDIEADWQTLTIRERARQISLSINGKTIPIEIRGQIWRKGVRVTLDKNGISFAHQGSGISELALVGMALNVDMEKFSLGLGQGNPSAMFISWPQRRERLWRAKAAWLKIVKDRDSIGTSDASEPTSSSKVS